MPKRLRPTAPFAADAVLVGDPGRALLLAQELLEEPKMSNHARGLWGYGGRTAAGRPLTIQSTGMGGPSAAVVLADLAKLGVRRAVRVGTCAAVGERGRPGELLVVEAARAEGGSAGSFGLGVGEAAMPDATMTERLERELAEAARPATIASFDTLQSGPGRLEDNVVATDMQTATVFAAGRALGIAVAAVLIVDATDVGSRLEEEQLGEAVKRAGRAAAGSL